MNYRAVLKIANGAEAIGYGDSDHKAIQAALADSITMRQANPSQVVLAVWHDYNNAVSLSYCSRLSLYLDAIS